MMEIVILVSMAAVIIALLLFGYRVTELEETLDIAVETQYDNMVDLNKRIDELREEVTNDTATEKKSTTSKTRKKAK